MTWAKKAGFAIVALSSTYFSTAQTNSAPSQPMPRPYRGVQTRVDGIFVTPVPNAPFSATVQIVSHHPMPDGTDHVVTSIAHIARQSSGRIYNELRQLVPASYKGEPQLISAHIYDPSSRLNIFTNTATHIARQSILPQPPVTPARALPPQKLPPGSTENDLGMKSIGDAQLHGYRHTRTVPADLSDTGKPVVITDDYWYSEELSIYLIIRHDDPRTGEQLVAVTDVQRAEPPAQLFAVPRGYKVVDETPPPQFE